MDSFEKIHYDLDCQTVSDPALMRNIVKTISHIPQDHYDFIINNIMFLEFNAICQGQTISRKNIQKAFLILLKPPSNQNIIAHEIAHALLNHTLGAEINQEKEADDLIEKWGFKRVYREQEINHREEIKV